MGPKWAQDLARQTPWDFTAENNPLWLNVLPSGLTGVAMSPPQLGWDCTPRLWVALSPQFLWEPVWPTKTQAMALMISELPSGSFFPFLEKSTHLQLSLIRSHLLPPQFKLEVSCWGGWLILWFTPTGISLTNGWFFHTFSVVFQTHVLIFCNEDRLSIFQIFKFFLLNDSVFNSFLSSLTKLFLQHFA